jgi:hypothetical protein
MEHLHCFSCRSHVLKYPFVLFSSFSCIELPFYIYVKGCSIHCVTYSLVWLIFFTQFNIFFVYKILFVCWQTTSGVCCWSQVTVVVFSRAEFAASCLAAFIIYYNLLAGCLWRALPKVWLKFPTKKLKLFVDLQARHHVPNIVMVVSWGLRRKMTPMRTLWICRHRWMWLSRL